MLNRVISYIDGRVVYYYNDKEVTYRKDVKPEVILKIYNKKEVYGYLGLGTNIFSNSGGTSRH